MSPRVNIAVCGNFEQLQLVPRLNTLLDIQRVYYAHRASTNAHALGLSPDQACNVYLQQYLIHFHARYLKHFHSAFFYPIYNRIWEQVALSQWSRCDVLHAVIRGCERRLLERAKAEGSKVLGHPVTCHPSFLRQQLDVEHQALGITGQSFPEISQDMDREIELCDRLFCLSTLVRDTFIATGYPADRIDVVRMPTDLDAFRPGPSSYADTPLRVICVADISPRKGHIYLLDAWRRLAPAGAELLLVGTMQREMQPILARYEGLFRYLGPLNKAALIKLYQESSLLVLPSVEDGFGLVVAEAIACGLPVIVSDHVGAQDIVRQDDNGYVVPARDSRALAEAIAKVLSSSPLRRRFREGAIASRQDFPTLDAAAVRLATLCDQLSPRKDAA